MTTPAAVTEDTYTLLGIEPNQPFSKICAYRVRTAPQSYRDVQIIASGLEAAWEADLLALTIREDGTVKMAAPMSYDEALKLIKRSAWLTYFVNPRMLAQDAAMELYMDSHMDSAQFRAISEWTVPS